MTEKKIKKLIERQKREVLQDQFVKLRELSPNVFYDFPLTPHYGCHASGLPTKLCKSTPDLRTFSSISSKKSTSVQTCPSHDCRKKYPSSQTTKCHDPIILPSKHIHEAICNRRRSLSTPGLRKTPTCDKAVQVRRSPLDPSRSMTNLPKDHLTEKLINAAAERRFIAMNRESFDVSSCRRQNPANYDKEEVRYFMKMRQVMSKKVESESRPSTARKRIVDYETPTKPTLERSATRTIFTTSDRPRDEIIVNRADIVNGSKSDGQKKSSINHRNNNVTRHRLNSKELRAMLDEILLQNNVIGDSKSIKLPKVNNLFGKLNLDDIERSDDELPSFLKPKNISSFDTIHDSWSPDVNFDGDFSSILSPKNQSPQENILNNSKHGNSFCTVNSSRHDNSIHEHERKEDSVSDRRLELLELSRVDLENSKNRGSENSFSLPKVSFEDVVSNILQRHKQEKEKCQATGSNSSSNSDNTYQANSKSIHDSDNDLSSLSDESSSTCSGKSYELTSTTEPTTTQSDSTKKPDQEQLEKEENSSSNSISNDLSITERINLIYSQRNISPSSSFTDLNQKSLSDREIHMKCLRLTPEIDLEENDAPSPKVPDEVDHGKEADDGHDKVAEKDKSVIKEVVDEEKYELSDEMVSRMVREICDLIIINNQVEKPDEWKWNVSQKYICFQSQPDHIEQSINCYRRFLCDLIESVMSDVFLNGTESKFDFKSQNIKSMARLARKKQIPRTSSELFEIINPVILKTIGLKSPPKPNISKDGILGYCKKCLNRDQVDIVALNEMVEESDQWTNYDKEVDELVDVLSEKLFDTLLESLAREAIDISPPNVD